MGWDLGSDSPLLRADGRRRARFAFTPPPPTAPGEVGGLLAGAAEVDVTPPPGMPKAGYSSNAHDGAGFRTRLRARVLHLRSGRASVALVMCDLLGGSSVLQHLVAAAVADRTDVPLGGVFIGATHTHAGPGQFLGTDFYNRFASNRGGFDPAWTQFLADRIASAVADAVAWRQPARAAYGHTDVWGLTRNRSLSPHVRNSSVTDKRTEPQRKFAAVNPRLHLLRVDTVAADGGAEPLAAAVIFSVHGTGISMRSREYNADLWAYLVGEMAHRVEASHGRRPVIGAMEGTHADVAPAIRPGGAGYLEAQRVGAGIGAEAAELFGRLDDRLSDQVDVGAAFAEVDLAREPAIDGIRLPVRPAVGAALVAGAQENLTPLIGRLPPFRAGSPKRHDGGPQGAKRVLGSRWGQPLVLPLRGFPRVLPVHLLRIGPAVIVGLPFEVTVEAGRRVAADVTRTSGATDVIVSSVANEYSGYVTTAEEYALQYYEGGHNLYGPRTLDFLAAHAARLAGSLRPGAMVQRSLPARRFDLRVQRYLARPEPAVVPRRDIGPASFVDPTLVTDGYWEAHWSDVAPGNLHWYEPLVRVEAEGPDGWRPARRRGRPVDDQGWDLEVVALGPAGDGHRYRVRWYDPDLRGDRRHRFALLANAGRPESASNPFD